MSTRFDMIDAKRAHTDHVGMHKCNALDPDTGLYKPCAIRSALWREYVGAKKSMAGKWGLEFGDDDRQRDQYNALHSGG